MSAYIIYLCLSLVMGIMTSLYMIRSEKCNILNRILSNPLYKNCSNKQFSTPEVQERILSAFTIEIQKYNVPGAFIFFAIVGAIVWPVFFFIIPTSWIEEKYSESRLCKSLEQKTKARKKLKHQKKLDRLRMLEQKSDAKNELKRQKELNKLNALMQKLGRIEKSNVPETAISKAERMTGAETGLSRDCVA